MVYEVKKPELDEEEGKEEEGFIQGGAPGGVMTAGGGAAAPAAKVEAPKAGAGAGITDIQKYLAANRPKIQKLASDVGGVISGDVGEARTGLEGAGTRFKEDVAGGTVGMDEDIFGRAKQELTDKDYVIPQAPQAPLVAQPPTPIATSGPAIEPVFDGLQPEIRTTEYIDPYKYDEGMQDQIRGYDEQIANLQKDSAMKEELYNVKGIDKTRQVYDYTPEQQAELDRLFALKKGIFDDPSYKTLGEGAQYTDPNVGLDASGKPIATPREMGGEVAPQPETPTSFLGDEAAVQRFKELYGAQYGGPQDIMGQEYYQTALGQAQKAMRTKGLIESGEGLEELIARARPSESGRYSKGVLDLDKALLAADAESMEALRATAGESDIQSRLDALKAMASGEVLSGRETSAETRRRMQEEFNIGREEGEFETQAGDIRAQAEKDYLAKLEEIKAQYGVGTKESEYLDATGYFDQGRTGQISKYNVATAEDYSRLKALEELTGVKSTFSPYELQAGKYGEYADPTQAFNLEKYQTDVAARRSAREENARLADEYTQAQESATAAAQERADAQDKKEKATATGTVIGATAGAIVGSYFPVVGTAAGAVIGGFLGGAIGGLFCFPNHTEVKMQDGSFKPICYIELGDIVYEGGKVYGKSSYLNNSPMYDYCGTLVSGSHAVKENGKWVRVNKSQQAMVCDDEIEYVTTLSCENHIMIINDTVFADYDEIDNSQGLTDDQCLKVLNGDK